MSTRFSRVGIDIDRSPNQDADSFRRAMSRVHARAKKHGKIVWSGSTVGGAHVKVELNRRVGFWRSIEIRYDIGDDPARMFYDIMRWRSGGRMVDTLFDKKVKWTGTKYNADL